jgi:hypothetical protein
VSENKMLRALIWNQREIKEAGEHYVRGFT